MPYLLLANLAASLFMTGLIWLVQLVHYPLFAEVGAEQARKYHAAHVGRITPLVGIVMLVEVLSGLVLLSASASLIPTWVNWLAVALLGVIWLSTALLQVPLHNRLGNGYEAGVHRRLVLSNWLRTLAWTARSGLLFYTLARLL